ncbi:octopamine receptor beta-2R-like [Clytia hemisphaerica]
MTSFNATLLHRNQTFFMSTLLPPSEPPTALNHSLSFVNVVSLLMLGTLVICIIGGNVLVISAFMTNGRKIQTITNYFVVSLAVSDILVGVFSVPFWMLVEINHEQSSSLPHIVFLALDVMLGVASIVHLTVISLERLFAVIRPATHRNLSRQTHLVRIAVFAVWGFAIVNSALSFVKTYYGWKAYNIYIVVIGFVVPALIIVCSYVAIYRVAQQHISEQKKLKQEMRLAGMIAIVIILFIVCWFPFFLINILYEYCYPPECSHVIIEKSIPFVKFLHYSNSMMNPLVYAYRNSDYRQAFKNLLLSLLKRQALRKRSASGLSSGTGRSDLDDFMDSVQNLNQMSKHESAV